ncbi:MAG: hypothetical protein ACRC7I_12745 [Selenomonadaceae bacterium]
MMGEDKREENRIARRDKAAYKKCYAPRQGGLPLGHSKEYWQQRRVAKATE